MWRAAAKRSRHAPFSPKIQKIEIATTCLGHIVSALIGRFFGNWSFSGVLVRYLRACQHWNSCTYYSWAQKYRK